MFSKLHQALGFTRTEGRVVVVLVISFVIGLGIKVVKDTSQGSTRFDYSAADSEFAARSAIRGADTLPKAGTMAVQVPAPADPDAYSSAVMDVNTATKNDLMALPGIGDAIAERIIGYREEHGKFTSLDELLNVKGIGAKKLELIRPFCRIGK